MNGLTRAVQAADRDAAGLALVGAWLGIVLATAMGAFGLGMVIAGMNFELRPLIASMPPWLVLMMTVGFVVYVVAVALLGRRTLRALRGGGGQGGA